MPLELATPIGRASAIGRHQQQLRRLDGVAGHDEHIGRHRPRPRLRAVLGLVLQIVDLADLAVAADDDLAGDGAVADFDIAGLQRVVEGNAGVVFRLDRTDRNAIGVAGADAAALVRLRIATGRRFGHRQRNAVDGQAGNAGGDRVVDHRHRDRRHRIIVIGREGDAEIVLVGLVGRHADLVLGAAVPDLQLVVAEWPVDEAAIDGLHLEVVRHEAKAGAEPMPRGAGADAVIGAAEGERALLDQIGLLGVLPIVGVERQHRRPAGIPGAGVGQRVAARRREDFRRVGNLRHLAGGKEKALEESVDIGRHFGAGLDDQNALALEAELLGDQRARYPRPDDYHIILRRLLRVHHHPSTKSESDGGGDDQ